MATKKRSKKRRFSNNQVVVFRFGERTLVGQIVQIKPVGRRFIYDVLGEDQKIYPELDVDVEVNECIDTRLTKLYYTKYNYDEKTIPEILPDNNMPLLTKLAEQMLDVDDDVEVETERIFVDDAPLYEIDDEDSNY